MALSPDEVRNKTFSIVKKGYERGEVHRFLDDVARQLSDFTTATNAPTDAVVVDAKAHAGAAINGAYGMLTMLLYGRSPRIANDRDVITNAPPGTPFRGPGGPTYAWALEQAVDDRFRVYNGDKFYHIALKVEGYILAVPGVPLVASPKSALIFTASVWDDAAGGRINDEPEQFTVFESVNPNTLFSSGLTRTREEQIEDLSRNAARAVHNWMLQNGQWFGQAPSTLDAPLAVEAPSAETVPLEAPEGVEETVIGTETLPEPEIAPSLPTDA